MFGETKNVSYAGEYENRIGTYKKSNINLCKQADEVQEDAQPTTPDTEGGAVWQFID